MNALYESSTNLVLYMQAKLLRLRWAEETGSHIPRGISSGYLDLIDAHAEYVSIVVLDEDYLLTNPHCLSSILHSSEAAFFYCGRHHDAIVAAQMEQQESIDEGAARQVYTQVLSLIDTDKTDTIFYLD